MNHASYLTFMTIIETGSLAATARKLHLSPSAVSKQLATLEQRLGTQLIQRSTRSMQVTEAGECFFQRCIEITQAVEAAETEIRDLVTAPSGTLRITLPQVLVTRDFADLLRQFGELYPGISISLEVSNNIERLIEKNLDLGFRAGPLQDSRMVATELFQSQIVLCASPGYAASHGIPANADQLVKHTLLIPDFVYLNPTAARSGNRVSPVTPGRHILCDSMAMLIELACAGAGLALAWDYSLADQVENKNLLRFPSPIPHAPRPVSMIYLSRDYIPQRTRLFMDHVKQHYAPRAERH